MNCIQNNDIIRPLQVQNVKMEIWQCYPQMVGNNDLA